VLIAIAMIVLDWFRITMRRHLNNSQERDWHMTQIVTWITTNWSDVITVYSSIIIAARIIIKLIPAPAAGSALESVVVFLGHVGLVVKS
jgi:hypothetical protein